MDVVLQTAVLGVGLLQSVLHVLHLTLVTTLHLDKTSELKLGRVPGSKAVYRFLSVTYLLFAALQLTLLGFGSAQLALQVQRFTLRCSLFGQNFLHVVFHLQAEDAYISLHVLLYSNTTLKKIFPPVSVHHPGCFVTAWTGRCTRASSRPAASERAAD